MKIGLTLSSGGVLGVAHIGVLHQIEKNNIKISAISGSSAGAIAGLLFASGGTKAVDGFFSEIIDGKIFSKINIIKNGKGDKFFNQIIDLIFKYVPEKNFSDLEIPYSCAATDFKTGETKIFTKGEIRPALSASIVYPGVFPMQCIAGRYYIDGGVACNMPVDQLKKQKMDFIIGSSIYKLSPLPKKKKIGRVAVATRAFEIMEKKLNDIEIRKCDFCFTPSVGQFYWYNFTKTLEIKMIGEKHAREKINILLEILNKN
ncbi:MAG: patatin-like phospholipase family protein [Patescibacteria group bacterium]|jgi:NTE family protein